MDVDPLLVHESHISRVVAPPGIERTSWMHATLAQIDIVLARIEQLAEALPLDPDGHVLRSTNELRAAFSARGAIEPAVERVRDSVHTLRNGNDDASGRESQRRAHDVDDLERVMERELLPKLRRVGFDV